MSCLNPQMIPYKGKDDSPLQYMPVPCGKCEGCLSDRRNQWVYRLESEMRSSKHSYFVTLTYDERSLPLTADGISFVRYEDFISLIDFDIKVPSLYPKDLTNYFKRVRKELSSFVDNPSFKYFACGEYGSHSSNRPHYHIACFSDVSDPVLIENALRSKWQFGFIDIRPLIPNRCAYVCKYILKDSDLNAKFDCQVPYFSRSSNGLGIDGFFKDEKFFGSNFNSVPLSSGKYIAIPRYFRKKFYTTEEWNTEKQFKQEELNVKRSKSISERLQQDYIIKTGSRDPEQIAKFIHDQTDYQTIGRVRKLIRKRKKDF